MMPAGPRVRVRRWAAALIITLFFAAVAGSAAVGWWYARESPPHQGPIVLVSVDGVPAADLPAYGAQRSDTPAIDTLAADSVIFERAYTHSPQTLPAQTSLLTGQLPIQHGVRDDAGFSLPQSTSTMAELLRNRGFATGAAVSSFLLQRGTGIGQGFTYFNDDLPAMPAGEPPAVERNGAQTVDAAERWMATQSGQRFFLFIEVAARDADSAVLRLSSTLKQRGLYDEATIVLVGDRGDVGSGLTLDDRALRVPLMVKQPDGQGARSRVPAPVQNVDLLPTILDLVRAPVPDGLPGRSLRAVLDDADATLANVPIYSESLAAYFRFGGEPTYALTGSQFRYIRGVGEDLVPLPHAEEAGDSGASNEAARLRSRLDTLLATARATTPDPIPPSQEDRYALLGYLGADGPITPIDTTLDPNAQKALVDEHRAAAILIGQKKYTAGIRALQAIAHAHPSFVAIHRQLGAVLARTGRLEEAVVEYTRVRELQPDSPFAARALADVLLSAGRVDAARQQAADAVMLAEDAGPRALFVSHEVSARVALASKDTDAAMMHAEAAHKADPDMPVPQFVQGRILFDEGKYGEAAEALEQAATTLARRGRTLPDLHLTLGDAYARLERYEDAETQFREELKDHPRNMLAYTSLAMLYRASNRDADVEDALNELVAATPTPEGYAVAARLWTILGDPTRAEALRSDARLRFRGDPSVALLGKGRR